MPISLVADDNRDGVPIVLVHGIEGNRNDQGSDSISQPNLTYFTNLESELGKDVISNKAYHVYEFHYVSDVCSVSDIAAGMADAIQRAMASTGPDRFPGHQFIIIAHSMGGLVARAFMDTTFVVQLGSVPFRGVQKTSRGGDAVFRLITLATPHHGSPAANGLARFGNVGGLVGGTQASFWADAASALSGLFWLKGNCGLRCLSPTHYNRADLRWDNLDDLLSPLYGTWASTEENDWLRNLNAANPEHESDDSKIVAYWGSLAGRPEFANFALSDPLSLVEWAAGAGILRLASDKVGEQLFSDNDFLGAFSVLTQRIDSQDVNPFDSPPGSTNDGLVPIRSARFAGHNVMKVVGCPGYSHVDMEGGTPGFPPPSTLCSDEKLLLPSVAAEIPQVTLQSTLPPNITALQVFSVSWNINDAAAGARSWVEWWDNASDCTLAAPCKSPIQSGSAGNYSTSLTISPSSPSEDKIWFRVALDTGGFVVPTPWQQRTLVDIPSPPPGGLPLLSAAPTSVQFSSVAIGGQVAETVNIRNIGTALLSGAATTTSPYMVVFGASFNLAPGQSTQTVVRFTPSAASQYSGALSLTSNGGASSISLIGSGVSPALTFLPVVATLAATSISQTGATLDGTVNPNNSSAQGWFEWGIASVSENRTTARFLGNGGGAVSLSQSLDNLVPGQTYRYRIVGQNGVGAAPGSESTFTTRSAPASALICQSGSLNFDTTIGMDPSSEAELITNCGAGTLAFSVTSDAPWVTVAIASGTSTGSSVAVPVTVDSSNLSPGTYASTLHVTAPGGLSQFVAVYLKVTAPAPATVDQPFSFPFLAGSWGSVAWKVARDSSGDILIGGISGSDSRVPQVEGVFKYDPRGNYVSRVSPPGYQFAAAPSGGIAVITNGATVGGNPVIELNAYDSSGAKLWTKQYVPQWDATAFGVAADSSGNYFAAGKETKSYGSSGALYFLQSGVIVRFTSAGAIAWTRYAPAIFPNQNALIKDVAVAPGGGIFVGGTAQEVDVFTDANGNPGENTTNIYSPFIAQYDVHSAHLERISSNLAVFTDETCCPLEPSQPGSRRPASEREFS